MWVRKVIAYSLVLSALAGCVTYTINSDGSVQSNVIDKTKLSNTYIDLAIEYQQHNAPQIALERANLAITTQPSNAKAYMIRAMIYQQLGKPENAENDFKKALSIKGEYPEDQVNYAVFLCKQKRYDEAMQRFATALNDPLYVSPEVGYYSRGQCYFQKNDYTAANNDYLKSLSYRNAPQDVYLAIAGLQYQNKNYAVANYYVNKFGGSQTPASMWLHIQILQALLDSANEPGKTREYTGYRNTLGQLLVKNYGDTPEAQQYMLRYGSGTTPRNSANSGGVKPIIVKDAATGQTTAFAQPVVSNPQASSTLAAVATSADARSTPDNSSSGTAIPTSTRDVAQMDNSGRRYVILQNGDTVFRISRKYSIPAKQLEQINNLHSQNVKIGMKLYLDPKLN